MSSLHTQTTQKWTYQDVLEKIPEETCVEILNNELYMSPAPSAEHQRILKRLFRLLDSFVESLKIGEINIAPFDVVLDQNNVVQPDLFLLTTENLVKIKAKGVEGSPDLIVEIVSPSSFYRDTVEKKEQYEKFGIKEYWIVDPANKVIEVFSLVNNKYQLHTFVAESGIVSSALLIGFEVNTSDIF